MGEDHLEDEHKQGGSICGVRELGGIDAFLFVSIHDSVRCGIGALELAEWIEGIGRWEIGFGEGERC